jgi:hypothetical protein
MKMDAVYCQSDICYFGMEALLAISHSFCDCNIIWTSPNYSIYTLYLGNQIACHESFRAVEMILISEFLQQALVCFLHRFLSP